MNAVARAHDVNADPQKTAISKKAEAETRRPAPVARSQTARVLWREVPEWHTLPGDPAAENTKSARAYARAGDLYAKPVAGRIANQVA
ncbi:MAG: hypothetical protein ACFB0Z_05060 [Candidatus Phaeomarinobacter sp.]